MSTARFDELDQEHVGVFCRPSFPIFKRSGHVKGVDGREKTRWERDDQKNPEERKAGTRHIPPTRTEDSYHANPFTPDS